MKIEIGETFDEISRKAAQYIVEKIRQKNDLLLCAATGGSPTLTYRLLVDEYQAQPALFSQMRVIKLDEWGGIPMDSPATCESYLKTHLTGPLGIPASRYTGFNSLPEDPRDECRRVQDALANEGPVDICVLGMGMNGHLALNEPSGSLNPDCHVAELSETSLTHPMIAGMEKEPGYGLTLGMADILRSGMILILVHGKQKKEMVRAFLSKKITSFMPASFLWLHPNVVCLIEKDILGS